MAQHPVPEQLRKAVIADLVSRIAEHGRERPQGAEDALSILKSLPEINEGTELEIIWYSDSHLRATATLSLNAQAIVLSIAGDEGSQEIYSCRAGFFPDIDRDDFSAWLSHVRTLDSPEITISALVGDVNERDEEESRSNNDFSEAPRSHLTSDFEPVPVSLAPAADKVVRRATRFLRMVQHLHQAGYQRLRIVPGMAPSGCDWRCMIVADGQVRENGWEPKGSGWEELAQQDLAAVYSTGDETNYFDWADASSDNARQLAAKFLERFPELEWAGRGLDYAYAGWLTWTLGRAEAGELPIFYADYPVQVERSQLPPPPVEPTFGSRATLKNHELSVRDVGELGRWQEFALTFDERGWPNYDEFFRMAEERRSDTLTSLRARLFIKQRWFKFNEHAEPTQRDLQEVSELLGQIRQRVQIAQQLLA